MDYVKALVIKFVMCLAVLWLVLGVFYNVSFGHILTLSIILTPVSFILGDLFILRRFENWGATIADFLMVFAIVWFYGAYFINVTFPVITAAALSALIISVGEIFFHRYVDNHILHVEDDTRDRGRRGDRNLQTEFGEEIDPPPVDKDKL
ncbi:YndM family protein [Pseudogracilibacillus sp. SO30301A]|uniref:YndM family protein n=1 Tax=Pseudogracilibacillus sp. SO30301A TaxID=3098291 RepID=UPI00300DE2F4